MIDVVRNDINVTPLVDVMLVLLIIFMLMTLVMGRGHDVKLPSARNYSQEKDKMQPVVTIEKDGTVFVEKDKIGMGSVPGQTPGPDGRIRMVGNESVLKEMQQRVEAAWKAPKNPEAGRRIYLKAAVETPYGNIYPILEYMNKVMQMSNVDLAIAKDSEDK